MPLIDVGPETPKVTNEKGGQQSRSAYAFHLIPPEALFAIAGRFAYGISRGYQPNNWMLIPSAEHMNHMMIHALAHQDGDTSDDHLSGMLCRAVMFYYMAKLEEEAAKREDH